MRMARIRRRSILEDSMTGLRLLTSPAVLNGRPTSDDDDDITIARKYFSHHAFSDVSVQNYKGKWG